MTIGDRIKEKRLALGWSQLELAKRAGVSQQMVTRLETGKACETRKAGAIAKALGMSTDVLLGRTDSIARLPTVTDEQIDTLLDALGHDPETSRNYDVVRLWLRML